jgi:hypothetical protein
VEGSLGGEIGSVTAPRRVQGERILLAEPKISGLGAVFPSQQAREKVFREVVGAHRNGCVGWLFDDM